MHTELYTCIHMTILAASEDPIGWPVATFQRGLGAAGSGLPRVPSPVAAAAAVAGYDRERGTWGGAKAVSP